MSRTLPSYFGSGSAVKRAAAIMHCTSQNRAKVVEESEPPQADARDRIWLFHGDLFESDGTAWKFSLTMVKDANQKWIFGSFERPVRK